MAVEAKFDEGRPKTFLQPEGLFGITPPTWKSFLLGHAKHADKKCWSPEKPIRGLPDRSMRSDWTWDYMEKYEGYSEEQLSKIFTYYTLKELEEFDLDKPLGVPRDPESSSKFVYCVDIDLKSRSTWESKSCKSFRAETILRGLESGEPIEVDPDEEKLGSSTKERLPENPVIRVKKRKRLYYAEGFKALVETISRIYRNEDFDLKHNRNKELTKEDIRLVVGASPESAL